MNCRQDIYYLRHCLDGVKAKNTLKSIFYKNENIIELALDGWSNGQFIDASTKVYDCGRFIGIDLIDNPTTKIKIVLNETMDSFRTVFPC